MVLVQRSTDPIDGPSFYARTVDGARRSQNKQATSSDEDTTSESVLIPRNENPTPVAGEPNRWCVEGQWQIYRDANMITDKEKISRIVTEERRVLIGSLHTVPDIHRLFNLHKCYWMARDPGTYSEEMVREFYASYAATLRGSITKRVSPTKTDNQLTWDRAVMVAAFVAGVKIDFARMLLAEIHERAFKTSTTYPFPSPTIDLSCFQAKLVSLRTDVDAILATPTVEPQAAPAALADDTVLDALFSGTTEEKFAPTHTKGKRHRSSRTEEEKALKRQRRQEKEARKASILDEELRQQRVSEGIARASSSAPVIEVPPVVRDVVSITADVVRVIESTTEGAMMDDVGTTEGDPTIVPAGSGKPDPSVC
uniref:Integrase core domain containing protein n=1 Tax=Solanum tuberosum TaxID=4113 RepID=M1DVG6_SOLTU